MIFLHSRAVNGNRFCAACCRNNSAIAILWSLHEGRRAARKLVGTFYYKHVTFFQ